MNLFSRFKKPTASPLEPKIHLLSERKPAQTGTRYEAVLKNSADDIISGRYRYQLYRFLADTIPAVQACLTTWVRITAAPGEYKIKGDNQQALAILNRLKKSLHVGPSGNNGGFNTFLSHLATALYRDGFFGGFIMLNPTADRIERFLPVITGNVQFDRKKGLSCEHDNGKLPLTTPDFYHLTLNADHTNPLGKSIMQAIPFVTYIEQQLVEDMRRASHNAGFHKLHVKITPPERLSGESDNNYIDRINSYFDSTVGMIKNIEVDENPVTWDNIEIKAVGPENVRAVTNSWFMNHRAMIEEICAGTNLSPFLLGYSFGSTTTWASFKFDLVMRQVRSIQAEISSFLSWLGNVELALHGLNTTCEFVFDNSFPYQAGETADIRSKEIDSLIKLYNAGLLDETVAREKIGGLL